MKKTLLTILFTLLLAPAVNAAFSDVNQAHESSIAIEYLQQEEIIGGYPDGTFRPNFAINRAEMMKILVEGQGVTPSESTYNNCFPDVGDEWFAKYVCYAKENDWVGGYPDGTFKPANNVLDVEAMKMVLNAKGINIDEGFTPQIFASVPPDAWYRPFLVTAEKLKLTEGFTPGSKFTRAEVSETIFRTLVIERTDEAVYSMAAQNELLNVEVEEAETNYGAASYLSYTPELRASLEGSQPFVIFFHASWCPICLGIENDIKANIDGYPDGYKVLEADFDTETELKKEFGVTRQYWFTVFDAEGEIVHNNNFFNAADLLDKVIETL